MSRPGIGNLPGVHREPYGEPWIKSRGPARVVRFDRDTGTCEIEFEATTLHTGLGEKTPEVPARMRFTKARDFELRDVRPPHRLATGEYVMEGAGEVVLLDGTRIPCRVILATGDAGQVTGIVDSDR